MSDLADPQMSEKFDYIVVGAGSAGCVLANRLSADPANRVLLIEAGKPDDSFLFRMPKGFARLIPDPDKSWHFPAEGDEGNAFRPGTWERGKTLGGSSAINGMVYMRCQPQDYDDWAANGCPGWSWKEIGPIFRQMEDHALGADEYRGVGGPLQISPAPHHPICDAVIDAGASLGLPRRDDINRPDQEGIAYVTRTIHRGIRSSASGAFLHPIRHRRNLVIYTETEARKIEFDGRRAVAVNCIRNGVSSRYLARHEIILSAGTIQSPRLLQVSGVGPAEHLRALGIPVISDLPGVGQNLHEHYLMMVNFRLNCELSHNREFSGWRLYRNVLQYFLTRRGVMARGSHEVAAFFRSRPGLDRPDAEILVAPWSLSFSPKGPPFDSFPGIHLFAYRLRPESTGSIMIRSADPAESLQIKPRYLATDEDRRVAVDSFRFIRRITQQEPLTQVVVAETRPGANVKTDDEILDAYRRLGQIGHHAAGTCKMGNDPMSVVDERTRVRGVDGLRVMDISVMPTLTSGNTNGPAMAMGWRAADLILEDKRGT